MIIGTAKIKRKWGAPEKFPNFETARECLRAKSDQIAIWEIENPVYIYTTFLQFTGGFYANLKNFEHEYRQ